LPSFPYSLEPQMSLVRFK